MEKVYLSVRKRLIPIVLTFGILIFHFSPVIAQGPGAAWQYSRCISLSTPTTMAGYQVKLVLTNNEYTNMKVDGSDIRIYDASNNNCPYWIEHWDINGQSIIWVKVTANNTSALTMYYGNPAAPAVTNGAATFDWFDDFTGATLNANWNVYQTGGTGSNVTLNGNEVSINNNSGNWIEISSQFPTASTAFFLESKFRSTYDYYRNRFYASTDLNPTIADQRPAGIGFDYGYFQSGASSYVFWNGFTGTGVYANNDYISQWALTDANIANNYTWNTLEYPSYNQLATHDTTFNNDIRYINIAVTEKGNTNSIVDWVRVRKRQATEPVLTVGPQVPLVLTATATTICAGTSVTFTASGYGFTSYQFKVNGTNYLGPTPINAVAINNLANGDKVTVTSTACSNTVTSNEITMVVNPLPTASLSVPKTSICAGESITFTAATAGNPVNTTYDFKVDGSTVQSGTSNTYTTNSLTNGQVVTMIATTPAGCPATSAGITMTVNPLPTGTLSSSDADNKICAGTSITFTATSGFSTYEFFVDGVSQGIQTGNTFNSTTLAPPIRSIGVRVTNSNGCFTDISPIAVTVYALPSGSISVLENSGTPNNNVICAGSNVTFNAPSGNSNYRFYLNGTGAILNVDQTSNAYTTNSLSNGDHITAVVTNSSGCASTFNSPNITVNALPAGTLTASKNPVCAGESVIFTATDGTNYKFYLNGTLAQQGASSTYTHIPANNDQVTVEVSNSNGCIQTYAPVTMTVNPLPAGTLTFTESSGTTSNDGNICSGGSITFTAPSGYANYDFKVDGTSVQNSASNTLTTNTLATGNRSVTVTIASTAGCSATLPAVPVTVNPLPTVASITGTLTLCANATTQLADATGGGTWSSSNTSVATVNGSGLVTGASAGNTTITYTVTNANGCTDSKSVNVTVYAIPAPGTIGGTKSVCAGGAQTLTNSLGGGTWSSSNNSIATISSGGVVTGVVPGTVTITYSVTNVNGCTVAVTTSFEVFALPVVSPIGGPNSVCNLSSITLTDATPGGVWSSGNTAIATVNATTGAVTGVAAGAVTIYYSVTNGNGCNTTVSKSITVHALPNVTLSGPNPICKGTTGTYTTESGMTDYAWTIIGGTIASGGTNADNTVTVNWLDDLSSKSIYINYKDGNGCSSETLVTVSTASPDQPVITGTNDICQEGTATYSTAAGNSTYSWNHVGGTVVAGGTKTDNTITIKWTAPGTQSVGVNYTNAAGCRATSSTVYNVTVHPLPLANVSASSTEVCQNSGNVTVTFTGSNATAPYTFHYKIDGGATQTLTTVSGSSATITISSATVTTHTVQLVDVTDNHGCTQAQTGSVSVQIDPLPTGTISGTTAVCKGATSPYITFTGATGTAPYTFTYNINGGASQTINTTSGNSVTIAVPTGTAGVYNYNLLSVADSKGCSQNQSGTATITVNPLPQATIAVNTTQVCKNGISPVVTFTGSNGTGPYTFTYKINGGASLTVSGNPTANVNVPTTTAGTFTYALVSVQDASSTACVQAQSGNVSIQVDPTSVGGTLTGNATVCYGFNSGSITLSGQTGNVIQWESSTNGGSTWSSISNTTTTLSYSNITQTTMYRAVVQSGVCSFANSTNVTITVNATSVGGSISGSTTVCSGTNSGSLTLSGNTGAVVRWEYSTDGGGSWNNITNSTNSEAYTNLTQTRQYRVLVQNTPCTSTYSNVATVTVNPLPNAAIAGAIAVCQDAPQPAISFTGSNATSPYTFTYTINGTPQPTIQGSPTTSVNVPTGTPGTYVYAITKVVASTGCTQNISGVSATVTVNPKPAAINITPNSATLCEGSIVSLVATLSTVTNGTKSGGPQTVNQTIPRNNSYLNSNIGISGIPAGAIVTGIDVKFNIQHDRTSDLRIFLQAPNGQILNLVNGRGSGKNFTNTTISSSSINPLTNNGNPFNGTYAASRANVNISTTTSWNSLFGISNGTWTLRASDFRSGTSGTLQNWSITIYYQLPSSPANVVWSPTTDLYTDPGANTAYTGTATSVIYVKPSTSGPKTYTATLTNGFGCSVTNNATLTVNPTPVVTLSSDYCSAPGKVRLNATSNPSGTYLWSTGETTQSIDVDIANDYDVTVTTAQGCTGTGTISVARELVENGDFEAGNDGSFSSGYLYVPDLPDPIRNELEPDNDNRGYSITTNGKYVHSNFWGFDHTSGSGNFMAVNGHDNINVWEETIDVLPNTTYYFAAWARSLNNVSPFAKLIFTINDVEVGSQLNLTARPGDSDPAHDNWQRFYGTWTSGPSTNSIVLKIKNKEPAHGGNDFAIDDISFATLSTFITLNTPAGTDAQEVCKNAPIGQIIYNVGNGTPGAPTITGLPDGVSAVWDQDRMIINGSPTTAGTYTYTISTTGGCNPKIKSGTIIVNEQKVALSNGLANNTLCINAALPSITYHLSGKATGAVVTGLPTGVTYSQTGNDVTISGTPSVAGTFNYTITTSGTSCDVDSKTGTIEVTTQSISESSGNKDQALCINTPIDNIVMTIAGTANGATVSGLPAGVTMTKNGQQYILSGTPTQSGAFNYTVTTTGTCSVTASISGTLNINPASVGGSLVQTTGSCTGTGIITLSGQAGAIQKWQKSTDNGVTWNDISNTTTTENYTGITTPVLYRAYVNNGCGVVTSPTLSVGRHNYWIGTVSSDWNTTGNWSDNLLPTTSCPDVYIPSSAPNQPVISTGSVLVNNIVLENGALLTITNDATFQVAGTFTAPGLARIDCSDGTLDLVGTTAQQIPANLFVNNNVKDLKLSNNAGVSMQGDVDIYNSLTFNSATATLQTNDHLTIKSNKQNTAWIGPITSSQAISGKATVERYINTGILPDEHARAWQLITFPTTGQSIKNALQEGATSFVQNPKPGFGTQITDSNSNWNSYGFDQLSFNPSMKVYNSDNNNFIGIPSTFIDVHNDHGYFMFVRGDRTSVGASSPASNTVLRSKGTLYTGLFTMPVKPNKFESVGNPYASSIDIRLFGFNNIGRDLTVWDPTDPSRGYFSTGIYQTLVFDGADYTATPGGGAYAGLQNFIQSGQAFYVQSNSGTPGSVTINENAKANGSKILMRTYTQKSNPIKIRSNLYLMQGGTPTLMDGSLSILNNEYNVGIDGEDARKILNSGENFGIYSGGEYLVVERRPVPVMTDTIFFRMTNMRKQPYKLEFINKNLERSGLEAWLEDQFTQKKTLLEPDGTTEINFEVTSAVASYATGRFRIVFKAAAGPLPVTFTNINAVLTNSDVLVSWSVQNQSGIEKYDIEKSADGVHFKSAHTLPANTLQNSQYQWLDQNPGSGVVYYRIKSVSKDGKPAYTSIVKVTVPLVVPTITVYPNPVKNGVIQLLFRNQPEGKYRMRVTDMNGRLVIEKYITRMAGNSLETLNWDYRLSHGIYNLEILKPDSGLHMIKVMY